MTHDKSLLDLLKNHKNVDFGRLVSKVSEIPQGSSSIDEAPLHYSLQQIEAILSAVPSIFPYSWSPRDIHDFWRECELTPSQYSTLCTLNNFKKMGGFPINIDKVAEIIKQAQSYLPIADRLF